jgi:signal transduction histidine kinase
MASGGTAWAGERPRTMSASKYPHVQGREPAERVPPAAAAAESGAPVLVQEKVLAEITHELGNFFHKLYYWSDYLKERPPRKSADSTAAQMLERTIRNLEDFLRVSLDYFHPTQLSFMRMPAGEVVEGLLCQVRAQLNGTPLTFSDAGGFGSEQVMVDPSQLSRAFEVALRHLTKQIGPDSALRIGIERSIRRDCPGVEVGFQLHEPNEASPLFRTSEAGVEWAVAQRVVSQHGGELLEHTEAPGQKILVVFLPLCP